METEQSSQKKEEARSCFDPAYDTEGHCVMFWSCICIITIIAWPICLGLGLYFLDDSNLLSSSSAIVTNIDPDDRCCSVSDDEYDCTGYNYKYQWLVYDSMDKDQCENITFYSRSFCYTSKKSQNDFGPDRILGENDTWYHDETCDDWSLYTPEQNETIGMYLIYVCIVSGVIYIFSTYATYKACGC